MASAATRFRSGPTLASHFTSNGAGAASGAVQTGPTVVAGVVALMAFLAFVFVVVTFIRRRSTVRA
jgi:hypothetical protein